MACLLAVMALAACGVGRPGATSPTPLPASVPATSAQRPLAQPGPCEGRFVAHRLDFVTGARMREILTYASNGAGVASGDLDGDGDLDLAFASIDRESSILWNEGGLQFRPEPIDARFTRAVNAVDVDGDGWLDLTFTHRGTAPPSLWRNGGPGAAPRFAPAELPGVDHFAYSMAWADLNDDGTLDLVTGAYDVELRNNGVPPETIASQGGVVLYEQRDGRFAAQQLSPRAEALAIGLVDLDGDGRRDIWAANDFALRDGYWLSRGGAWEPAEPFAQTSHSTMSVDWGDVENDGRLALFSTDMNPGELDPAVLAAWLPVISKLEEKHGPNDPQIMANVLQVRDGSRWRNAAPERGVDATGWSWSGKFGDLDGDGYLDLYVVNGMIAENLFAHLPGSELVEENRAFRNRGDGSFALAPEWGMGSTGSARGLVLADFDGDGDLDAVVNNLRSRAELLENRLCVGASLAVDVRWAGSRNSHALGAEVELHTSMGVLRRDLRSASGYLSGAPPRAFFGFPADTRLDRLVVRFPDGAVAEVAPVAPQTLIEVTR